MSYSIPYTATYRFPAATISSAATVGRIMGPAGMQGNLIDVSTVVTTEVTVADCTVTIGTEADTDAYGSLAVPQAVANVGANGVTDTNTKLAADTVVAVAAGGECTAGAADILVVIDWF